MASRIGLGAAWVQCAVFPPMYITTLGTYEIDTVWTSCVCSTACNHFMEVHQYEGML